MKTTLLQGHGRSDEVQRRRRPVFRRVGQTVRTTDLSERCRTTLVTAVLVSTWRCDNQHRLVCMADSLNLRKTEKHRKNIYIYTYIYIILQFCYCPLQLVKKQM